MTGLRILQPDQFVIAENDPRRREHDLLSEWLGSDRDPAAWMQENTIRAGDEPMLLATLARLRNLSAHSKLLSINNPYHHRLRILVVALLEGDVVLSEAATVALLEATPGGYQVGPERVFELAQACVARCGVTPGLLAGFRILARQASIWGKKSLRWKITTLIAGKCGKNRKSKHCWGEVIRAAILAMPPERLDAWKPLLDTIHMGTNPDPSTTWRRRAEKVVKKIGHEDLDEQLWKWFSLLETDGPFGLTTDGSYLMRTLIWYAMLEPNETGLRIVESVAGANWKKTRAIESLVGPVAKAAAAAAILLTKYPPADVWDLFGALDKLYGYPEGRVRTLYAQTAALLNRKVQVCDRPNPWEGRLSGLKELVLEHRARIGDPAMALAKQPD